MATGWYAPKSGRFFPQKDKTCNPKYLCKMYWTVPKRIIENRKVYFGGYFSYWYPGAVYVKIN